MWYCDICNKSNNRSESQKHKEKFGVVVEEFEFIGLDNNKIDSIKDNCARDFYNSYFHLFKIKCIYDFDLTNGDFANGIILIIT